MIQCGKKHRWKNLNKNFFKISFFYVNTWTPYKSLFLPTNSDKETK